MYHINLLEKNGFNDIVVSLKASNVKMMVEAYRKISKLIDYPLHLGVTEAGTAFQGTVKSAIGIGALVDGIGDTIRVSLTEDPVEEIKVAKEILKVLGLIEAGVEIVSCPTCGRTEIDLIGLAKKVEKEFENENRKIKIAVMGCVVNGPGEAREADYGVAGGKGVGVLFKKGQIVKKVDESEILIELKKLIMRRMRKMRVWRVVISLFFILLSACTSIRSNEEISLERVEGRKKFVVNYDRGRYNTVKLDNIVIDSGREYYVKEGEYTLSYIEEAFINGYVGVSWKGSKGRAGDNDRKIPTRKAIKVLEDMEINLENHTVQINFSGTINSDKKF